MDFSSADRWAATFFTVTAETALFSDERELRRLVRLPLRSTLSLVAAAVTAAAAGV